MSKTKHMNCPRCQNELKTIEVKEVNTTIELDQCEQCGGTWFDPGEIAPFQKIIEPVLWEVRDIPSKQEQFKNLYCPRCGSEKAMEKIPHPRDSNVIMDQCFDCGGIWLDHGEMTAIQKENWFLVLRSLFRSR